MTTANPATTDLSQSSHLFHGGVDEGVVAHVDEVAEEAAEDVLGDRAHGDGHRRQVAGLCHPLRANL